MSIWVGARVVGGLTIVLGLLALVAISWAARGVTDATQLFELLQGVILGTLGWLYGTQGSEAAREAAARESVGRLQAESGGDANEERMARLELDVERARGALAALRREETIREKVDEVLRSLDT